MTTRKTLMERTTPHPPAWMSIRGLCIGCIGACLAATGAIAAAEPPVPAIDGARVPSSAGDAPATLPTERVVRSSDTSLGGETGTASGALPAQQVPSLVYSNTGGTFAFRPGAGFRIADDIELTAECGCLLTSYSVQVDGGGDGSGTFDVTVSLYDDCPGAGGQLIGGTERVFAGLDDNGLRELTVDLSGSPVSIPGKLWTRVSFSTGAAGWTVGSLAELGFTDDIYHHPFTGCASGFGTAFIAGFYVKLFCEGAEAVAPLPDSPSPADLALDVSINATLAWNVPPGQVAEEPLPPTEGLYDRFDNVPECGTLRPGEVFARVRAAVEAGEIADPANRILPAVAPRAQRGQGGRNAVGTVQREDIFLFEDSADLLVSDFSDGALFDLMAVATNAVLAQHGDNFDFTGFWVNFTPDHQIGAAFYLGLENDVSGIGLGTFNRRSNLGVAGDNIEGFVMMWNQSSWSTGTNTFTQLVLGQEFEHRFGMFLNGLPGGRPLQGNNSSCGRGGHWNFKVDGQGSGMEIPEWIGSSPAVRQGGTLQFNKDIGTPGVFSYPDLYLMGYISPEELDTLPSELRYMDDNTTCTSPYNGPISTWDSSDIVATNGSRSPSSLSAQKDFRTAWIMIHRPGAPPSDSQLDRVVTMLNNWSSVYEFSTLGRGTMDNTTANFRPRCAVTHDVLFGAGDPPTTLICEDLLDTSCDPGTLECNTTYFWQVQSRFLDATQSGPVWSFTTPTGTEDCNDNGVVDVCDIRFDGAPDCQADGVPDECQVPPLDPLGADCNQNSIPDECDIADGLPDQNNDGVPDECETFPPAIAAAPHDIRKNRFISFDPNNPSTPIAIRVELTDQACSDTGKKCAVDSDCKACVGGASSGLPCIVGSDCSGGTCDVSGASCEPQGDPIVLGWVSNPFEPDSTTTSAPPGTVTATVQKSMPELRVWQESIVHLGDCEIAPAQSYALSVTPDGFLFGDRVSIGTIEQPSGKFWGDLVGSLVAGVWTPANGIVNVNDLSSLLNSLTAGRIAPHVTVVELVDETPTFIINASDLQNWLAAFGGKPYPPPAFPNQGGPADCP